MNEDMVLPGLKGESGMNKFKGGDYVKCYLNDTQYVLGTVCETCEDGTYYIDIGNGQYRHCSESELKLYKIV